MKKQSENTSTVDRVPLKQKTLLRYVGFEAIQSRRRLKFVAKAPGRDAVGITVDIPAAAFTGRPGIAIQDAAPMAYDKLVQLLYTEDARELKEVRLTGEDIVEYRSRHPSRSERRKSRLPKRLRRLPLAA
jgi:hypothetical protein